MGDLLGLGVIGAAVGKQLSANYTGLQLDLKLGDMVHQT